MDPHATGERPVLGVAGVSPAIESTVTGTGQDGCNQASARKTALDFLIRLFGKKPPLQMVLVWLLKGKRSTWFYDLNTAADFVERHLNRDVYIGVALSPGDFGPHKRCTADQVAGIVGLWVDFDIAGPAHQKQNLPP